MKTLFSKLTWKRLFFFGGLFVLAFVLAGQLLASWVLPGIIESTLAGLAHKTGIPALSFELRRVGLAGADLSAVMLGEEKTPVFRIDSLRIDYSLWQLCTERRIRRISASGIEVNCEFRNGQLAFPGFDLQKFMNSRSNGKKAETPPSSAQKIPTLPFDSVEIRKSTLACRVDESLFILPFEMKAAQAGSLELNLKIRLRDQKINLSVMDKGPSLTVLISADEFELSRFHDLLGEFCPGLELSGEAAFKFEANASLSPSLCLNSANFSLAIDKLSSSYCNIRIGHEKASPFGISGKIEEGKWNFIVNSFVLEAPLPVCIESCGFKNGQWEMKDRKFSANGNWIFKLRKPSEAPVPASLEIPVPIQFKGRLELEKNLAANGEWKLSLKSEDEPVSSWKLNASSARMESHQALLSANLHGNGGENYAKIEFSLPSLSCSAPFGTANLAELSFLCESSFGSAIKPKATFELKGRDIAVSAKTIELKVPQVSFFGAVDTKAAGGVLTLDDVSCLDTKAGLEITGLSSCVPFAFPAPKNASAGLMKADSIKYRGTLVGAPGFVLKQSGMGFSFSGAMPCSFAPGLADFQADGRVGFYDGAPYVKVNAKLPRSRLDGPLLLDPFAPALAGFQCEGQIELNASLEMAAKLTSTLKLGLADFKLANSSKGIAVEGMSLGLYFPSLHSFRSARKQELSFAKANIGKFSLSKGRVDFQVESLQSFFMENLAFEWCGGNVYSHAMRFMPGGNDYRPIFYCDRVRLTDILSQFGVGQAEGDGTLSGRIPLSFSKGKLTFDNGFLYSSPGDSGNIKLSGTESLIAGIPTDSPQFIHLELAQEALKDFSYDWSKLYLSSKPGDIMCLALEMDGKPKRPLPFEIGEDGSVLRSEGLVKFQGIRLAVNFNLPFNALVGYGQGVKGLLDNFNK
ncbi:MAG: hypothetical protein A2X49_09995 [Lentisphaerae bacterium GWF2_52_8]|nr:MAG: hypothetical protein A2X49_09995 [Lentisphaerae bacterium GWF2_52_8]